MELKLADGNQMGSHTRTKDRACSTPLRDTRQWKNYTMSAFPLRSYSSIDEWLSLFFWRRPDLSAQHFIEARSKPARNSLAESGNSSGHKTSGQDGTLFLLSESSMNFYSTSEQPTKTKFTETKLPEFCHFTLHSSSNPSQNLTSSNNLTAKGFVHLSPSPK